MKTSAETTNKDIFEVILQCLKKDYPPEKTLEVATWKHPEIELETIVKFVCEVYNVKIKQ